MTMRIYVVGGAVRDVLLGHQPKDLDYVVVGATEKNMFDRDFSKVGADFPVFLHPQSGDEYALARTERKVAAGYNGFEVDFDPSVTLEQDLVRRDLTINALAVPASDWPSFRDSRNSKFVIDYFGGIKDLELRTLRHVSHAFSEDPVRVLRVARFAARYNFNIEPETLNLMRALTQSGELDHLVPERVWTEMEKAMGEQFPGDFFVPLAGIGALKVLMPELDYGILTDANLTRAPRTVPKRFAALFANSSEEDIFEMCDRLKAPNDVRRLATRTRALVELCSSKLTPNAVVNTLTHMGCFQDPQDTWDALDVCQALTQTIMAAFSKRLDTVHQLQVPLRDVCFASLTADQQATLSGPDVGLALRDLRLNIVDEQIGRNNS